MVSEEERVKTLNELMNARVELLNQFEKLPITMQSRSAQLKKLEIEENLQKVENKIRLFNKKTVFVKI